MNMQQKERPSMQRNSPQVAEILSHWDKEMEKDKVTLKNLWLKTGDVVRDIDTANKMAKDKFDGDTAFMHLARGAVTTGVGAGLEKAMDFVWDRIWNGEIPFYDKSKFGEGMGKAMNDFAQKNDLTARSTYFLKESTQDLILAIFYNFMAFRGQPILPKSGPEHLVRSLGVNVVEALFAPSLPLEQKISAEHGNVNISEQKVEQARQRWLDIDSKRTNSPTNKGTEDRPFWQPNYVPTYPKETKKARIALNKAIHERNLHVMKERQYLLDIPARSVATDAEKLIRSITGLSNPITQLGVEWMITSGRTFILLLNEVRKIRSEKRLLGQKVTMPKKEEGWKKDNHGWQDKRPQQSDRRQYDDKKTVYYGKSRWGEEKRLEEYELKGS